MTDLGLLLIFSFNLCSVEPIWPPAYKINLSQEETFVIFEKFGSEDNIYSDEDEMIAPNTSQPKDHDDKFFMLHKLSKRKNAAYKTQFIEQEERYQKLREDISQYDEPVPWIGGYFDKKGDVKDNINVYYSNELAKRMISKNVLEKREEILSVQNVTEVKEEDYDYKSFQVEYSDEVKQAKTSNETANYTEVKEEESVQDAVASLVQFEKIPRNCTEEEVKGIGIGAVECFWLDIASVGNKTKEERFVLGKRVSKVVLIWFCVYIAIAIPCWCQKGWCCCCCRCKFCRPKETIDAAKKFLMDNPPGVYHSKEDGEILYEPTVYEKYAQKQLQQVIMKL